jgi:acyl-coenzyme A thioesterase PaaI-like protein
MQMNALLASLNSSRPSIAQLWTTLARLPGGKLLFSKFVGRAAPYTGTINAKVQVLEDGHSEVLLEDKRAVRNHLDCVHAIALMNLGEVATGLCMLYGVDGRGRGIIKALKMEYYKKARGNITASCWAKAPTTSGDHDIDVVAELRDEKGVVVAKAFATWKVTI